MVFSFFSVTSTGREEDDREGDPALRGGFRCVHAENTSGRIGCYDRGRHSAAGCRVAAAARSRQERSRADIEALERETDALSDEVLVEVAG